MTTNKSKIAAGAPEVFSTNTEGVSTFMQQFSGKNTLQQLHVLCSHISVTKIVQTISKGHIIGLDVMLQKCLEHYRACTKTPKATVNQMVANYDNFLSCVRGKSKRQPTSVKKAAPQKPRKEEQAIIDARKLVLVVTFSHIGMQTGKLGL